MDSQTVFGCDNAVHAYFNLYAAYMVCKWMCVFVFLCVCVCVCVCMCVCVCEGLARLIPVAGCVALRPVKEKKEKNNNKEKKENTEKARVRPCVAKKRKRKQRTHKEERESDIGMVKRTH